MKKNKPILRDLRDLLDETKQEIPRWFDGLISRESYSSGGSGRSRGGRGRGGRSFGARDARSDSHAWSNDRPSSGYGARSNHAASPIRSSNTTTTSSFGGSFGRGGTPRGGSGGGGSSRGDYGGRSFNRKFSNDGGDAW